MITLRLELTISRRGGFNEDDFQAKITERLNSLGYSVNAFNCTTDSCNLDKVLCDFSVKDKSQADMKANSLWYYRIIVENVHALQKEYNQFDIFAINVTQLC